MKQTILWHEECLVNCKRTHREAQEQINRMQRSLDYQVAKIAFYAQQIETAKAEGRTAFDEEQYMKRRKSLIVNPPPEIYTLSRPRGE